MRNIKICEEYCDYYLFYDSKYPQKDGSVISKPKYFCDIDERGVTRTSKGFSFSMIESTKEEFINAEIPENCPYILEQTILSKENIENLKKEV